MDDKTIDEVIEKKKKAFDKVDDIKKKYNITSDFLDKTDLNENMFNLSAEASILGCVLLDNSTLTEIMASLKPDDFDLYANRVIYSMMLKMRENGEFIDIVTLNKRLTDRSALKDAGETTYLCELSGVFTTAGLKGYINLVKEASSKRKIINIAEKMKGDIKMTDINALITDTTNKLSDINKDSSKDFHTISDTIDEVMNDLIDPNENKNVISTGYYDLDKMIIGLQAPDMLVLAARPAMGKTAFALNLARNIAFLGKKTAIFSLEMSEAQLQARMLCVHAKIDMHALQQKRGIERLAPKVKRAAQAIKEMPIIIDDTAGIGVDTLRANCGRIKKDYGLDVVIIDYLQYLKGTGKEYSREQEIAYISRSLKAMAKELNVPVLVLSQLNRNVEQRDNKRPRLSDLRESGAIEQDADIIMFLYRDVVYNDKIKEDDKDKAEIIVAKHRNGATGYLTLMFEKEYMKFNNLSNRQG